MLGTPLGVRLSHAAHLMHADMGFYPYLLPSLTKTSTQHGPRWANAAHGLSEHIQQAGGVSKPGNCLVITGIFHSVPVQVNPWR